MGGCVGMKSGLWVGSDGWDTFVGECAGVVNGLMVGFVYVGIDVECMWLWLWPEEISSSSSLEQTSQVTPGHSIGGNALFLLCARRRCEEIAVDITKPSS